MVWGKNRIPWWYISIYIYKLYCTLHYSGGFFVCKLSKLVVPQCLEVRWQIGQRPQSLTVRFFSVARPRDVPSAALMVPVALYSTWSIEKKSQSGPAALCLRWCHRDYSCVFWKKDATCFFAHQSQYIYIHHFMWDDCSGAEEVPSTKKLCWFCWLRLPFDNAVNVYGIIMCNSTFLRESWSPNSSPWQFLEYAHCQRITPLPDLVDHGFQLVAKALQLANNILHTKASEVKTIFVQCFLLNWNLRTRHQPPTSCYQRVIIIYSK